MTVPNQWRQHFDADRTRRKDRRTSRPPVRLNKHRWWQLPPVAEYQVHHAPSMHDWASFDRRWRYHKQDIVAVVNRIPIHDSFNVLLEYRCCATPWGERVMVCRPIVRV